MDNAVALVRAYLHVNGYFTVTEYPVLEAISDHGYQMKTDLDVLAVRFPGAGRRILQDNTRRFEPDAALGVPTDDPDMIIGEVKEGWARLNENATDPGVLAAALVRFGCCNADAAPEMARHLAHRGHVEMPNGHRARLVVFAGKADEGTRLSPWATSSVFCRNTWMSTGMPCATRK